MHGGGCCSGALVLGAVFTSFLGCIFLFQNNKITRSFYGTMRIANPLLAFGSTNSIQWSSISLKNKNKIQKNQTWQNQSLGEKKKKFRFSGKSIKIFREKFSGVVGEFVDTFFHCPIKLEMR